MTIVGKKKKREVLSSLKVQKSKQDKPHKCGVCDKSFPTPGDLKTHEVSAHGGGGGIGIGGGAQIHHPFRCHLCGKGFAKQLSARNHLIAHLTGRPKDT